MEKDDLIDKPVILYYQDVDSVHKHIGIYRGANELFVFMNSFFGKLTSYPLGRVIRIVELDENEYKKQIQRIALNTGDEHGRV